MLRSSSNRDARRCARQLRRYLTWPLAACLAALLSACNTVSPSDPELIAAALKAKPQSLETYVLGPGDSVSVSVWRNPDLSTETTIRPDGKLSSPLVGDLLAAGLAPEQLATSIEDRLSVYLKEPKVSVIVRNSSSYEFTNRIRVTGAVGNPQSVPYKEGMTILDVVLSAGGMTDFSDGGNSILYRQYQQQTVVIPIDLERIMNGGDIRANYRLLPGDVLTVPEKVL